MNIIRSKKIIIVIMSIAIVLLTLFLITKGDRIPQSNQYIDDEIKQQVAKESKDETEPHLNDESYDSANKGNIDNTNKGATADITDEEMILEGEGGGGSMEKIPNPGSVTLKILTPDGTPWEKISVAVNAENYKGDYEWSDVKGPNEKKEFKISPLFAGMANVVVVPWEGTEEDKKIGRYKPAWTTTTIEPNRNVEVVIHLQEIDKKISGQVVDAFSNPVEGVAVSIEQNIGYIDHGPWSVMEGGKFYNRWEVVTNGGTLQRIKTDTNGRFQFKCLGDSPIRLKVSSLDQREWASYLTVYPGDENIQVKTNIIR